VLRLATSLALLLAAPQPFHSSVAPVPASVRSEIVHAGLYHSGCPVTFDQLRVLTVTHWTFSGAPVTGQLVVNRSATAPLAAVFRKLYLQHFRIRHMRLTDAYGAKRLRPADGDYTDSFECRQAVPSPCSGGTGTGSWSEHAYGLAVDLNPIENPYVGCGHTRERASVPFLNRSRLRRGMVTPLVVADFRSVGWGWGGSWSGSTKDYMHFSASGH
jgi:D-alanyl-D-alanine carboxypeptidase